MWAIWSQGLAIVSPPAAPNYGLMAELPNPDLVKVLLLFEDIAPGTNAAADWRGHAETVVANVQEMFPGHEAAVAAVAQGLGLWDHASWIAPI
jgi:hypothetical protein